MLESMKSTLIGLFIVVGGILIVGIILFLQPSVGDGKETLVVRFSNINGISVGTRVMFAGKPVGEVIAIEQIPQARQQPTDELGQVYFYQLTLHVDSTVKLYNTDEVTVQTSGLLGEKSIALVPRAPPKGVTPTLITSKIPVYAEGVDPLEKTFDELSQVSDKVEETLDKVIAWIDQNGYELGSAIRAFDNAMTEASEVLYTVNQSDLVHELKLGVESFTTALKDIHHTIDYLTEENTFKNLATTLKNVKNASYSIDKVSKNLVEGKGTIGKLLVDDETYLRVTAILSKVDTLMNDVNQYGVFFNLNKQWQRTRVQKVSMLNALKTPESFKEYFTSEVDLISTSMARLSMLVEKAEQNPDREKIFDNKTFQKDFAELMRRSQTLYENLRLYNEQLIQAQKTGLNYCN